MSVTEVTTIDTPGYNTSYQYVLPHCPQRSSSWNVDISLNGCNIYFKLDTGSEVTVISDKALESLSLAGQTHSRRRGSGNTHIPYLCKLAGNNLASQVAFKWLTCHSPSLSATRILYESFMLLFVSTNIAYRPSKEK